MDRIKSLITKFLFFLISFMLFGIQEVMAFTSTELKLSEPRGKDILPSPQILESTNIQESFVFSKLIPFVITYAIGLTAALAVIGIIIGGYQYLTAFGNEEQYKKAANTIVTAVIGLILAITAFGIVKIITSLKFG